MGVRSFCLFNIFLFFPADPPNMISLTTKKGQLRSKRTHPYPTPRRLNSVSAGSWAPGSLRDAFPPPLGRVLDSFPAYTGHRQTFPWGRPAQHTPFSPDTQSPPLSHLGALTREVSLVNHRRKIGYRRGFTHSFKW